MNKKNIKNYVQNKNLNEKPCEEVLGDARLVNKFHVFWLENKNSLEVLKAALLIDYCETGEFNVEQYKEFKKGLDAFYMFFEECYWEKKNNDDLEKNLVVKD